MEHELDWPAGLSKTNQTVQLIRFALAEFLGIPEEKVLASSRFDAIIDRPIRREAWDLLGTVDIHLPPLELSSRAFLAVAVLVSAPLALLAFLINWSVLLT